MFPLDWDETGETVRGCEWLCQSGKRDIRELRQDTYCSGDTLVNCACACIATVDCDK